MKTPTNALDKLPVVQQTKLIPPTKVRALVARNRLLSRATDAAHARLLLITAGAGYGKTSLLVQVHERLAGQESCLSWFSLDEADNDHVRFLSHLVASLQKARPSFGAGLAVALCSAAPMTAQALRSKLLNDLIEIDQEWFVFLDDYHVIADADVRATLAAILLAPLPKLHFLMATRERNELPVSRLKAMDQIVEIGSPDLAFSDLEASQFIGDACSKPLDRHQVSRLLIRTEGWAASLQLAAIALNDSDDVAGFLQQFSGETPVVGEFLGDEVLRRQPPYLQQFLMETAILKRFNTSLARAVTGRDDSGSLLEEAEAKNLFIFSLDDQRNWFRYHHLFADFLQRRLRDRRPGVCEILHRRAAAWFMQSGSPIEAIEHAFLAADVEYAGRLLEESCTQLFAAGQLGILQKQADRLPRELFLRLPRLLLELTWDYELRWQFSAATDTLATVHALLEDVSKQGAQTMLAADKEFLQSKLAHREMMLAFLADRLPETLALAQQWTKMTPAEEPFMRASVGTAQMHVDRERYRCKDAPAIAQSLHQLFLQGGAHYGTVFHDCASALCLFMRGELAAAQHLYERARQTAIALQGEESQLTAMPTALLAELRYERGDVAGARDLLACHAPGTVEFGFADHPLARFVTAARLAFLGRHVEEADEMLAAGMQLADKHGLPRLHAHLLNEGVRELIADGHEHQAALLLEQPRHRGWFPALPPNQWSTTTDEMRMLAWSRVCISRGEQAQALPVLRRWVAYTHGRGCVRSAIRISAVLARLHASRDETGAALRVLRAALQMTDQDGFVRSFVDEGPLVVAVLQQWRTGMLAPLDITGRRVDGMLVAAELGIVCDRVHLSTVVSPRHVLTGRELEIVVLTAQGMATSDLASALGLTSSTVKWYWQRIFSKLEVHRRFEVVKVARHRGWIS